MALREDKTARVERIPGKTTGFVRQTTSPDEYEFSAGKYTRSGNIAANYIFRRIGPDDYKRFAELQLSQPVLAMQYEGTQWWWYWNRFWKEDETLSAADVQALLVQRERQRQAKLERARAGIIGAEPRAGVSTDAARDRLLKQEERERTQRRLRERATEVRHRNEQVDNTIAALETLLVVALDRDASDDSDLGGSDPEVVASYFSTVLEGSPYPEGFPRGRRVAFVPESRQLVVEYELPSVAIVPVPRNTGMSSRATRSRKRLGHSRRFEPSTDRSSRRQHSERSTSCSKQTAGPSWRRSCSTATWTRSIQLRASRHDRT